MHTHRGTSQHSVAPSLLLLLHGRLGACKVCAGLLPTQQVLSTSAHSFISNQNPKPP